MSFLTYNISGITNKVNFIHFFQFLQKFDLIVLIETNLMESNQAQITKFFLDFKIKFLPATKNCAKKLKKTSASGGILIRIKKMNHIPNI